MAKEETKKTTKAKTAPKKTTQKSSNQKTTKASTKSTSVSTKSSAGKTNTVNSTKNSVVVQEENHYGRTILAALLIVVIFIGGYLGIQYKKNNGQDSETKYVATADEKEFKEEYEKLNGTTRSNGEKNKDVEIMVDNNVKYINLKEAAEILESGSGIIYFGFAACPWCRNAVPVLLNAMESSDLDTIYYVNIKPEDDPEKDVRDTFVLDSKNKARKSRDAEDAYYDILRALANDLGDYVLTTDKGTTVNTGEKRLAAPTVVAVKDGIVVGFHAGTVEGHVKVDGALPDLTKDQETELLNTYSALIGKYLNNNCDEEC